MTGEDGNEGRVSDTNFRLYTWPRGAAIVAGLLHGIVFQCLAHNLRFVEFLTVMSLAYVFVLPVVLGFLTIWWGSAQERSRILYWIVSPWITIFLCLCAALVLEWEGAICLILGGAVYFPLSSVGGLIAGCIIRIRKRRGVHSSVIGTIAALPLFVGPLENLLPFSPRTTQAYTEIVINAPVETVWRNIIRVPAIDEPLSGIVYRLGFPKPVEATLSYEGVGGVRDASFEGGLKFRETIDEWTPLRKISFSIDVDPTSVPTTTLDRHVVVGGEYFDVLRGTYEIEQRSDGRVLLKLYSSFRVSTHFNFYAGWWATFLMEDVQNSILEVIKKRCEGERAPLLVS